MKLKYQYDSQDQIPAGYEELYTEQDGVFIFTGVEGLKSQADIDRLQTSLTKERNDHKNTKDKLKEFTNVVGTKTPAELQTELDELDDLRTGGGSGGTGGDAKDEAAIQAAAEKIAARKTTQLQRELDRATARNVELETENGTLKADKARGTIESAVRKELVAAKVLDTAVEDALLLAERHFEIGEDGSITTKDGLAPKDWLADLQSKRPHWWPASQGGGAGGNDGKQFDGNNPWTKAAWSLTEQGKIIQSKGQEVAERLAKQAGSRIGATKPPA